MEKQIITIKGNQEGLTFYIDDTSSFNEAIMELNEKLVTTPRRETDDLVSIIINLGNRYITDLQEEELTKIIEADNRFTVERFDSDVVSKLTAQAMFEEAEVKSYTRILRSGQVLEVTGDLLLIGDVNPGGQVRATGNIYVLGKLLGIAHAGCKGNRQAFIAASYMYPNQLRIADLISRPSDIETEGTYMEYGFIDPEENQISIGQFPSLQHIKNNSGDFEGE